MSLCLALPPTSASKEQRNLFSVQDGTDLTPAHNSAAQPAVILAIKAENGIKKNEINRGMMGRQSNGFPHPLVPCCFVHSPLPSLTPLSLMNYHTWMPKAPRTGQSCTFARTEHASTCKLDAALAFHILRGARVVRCRDAAKRDTDPRTVGIFNCRYHRG